MKFHEGKICYGSVKFNTFLNEAGLKSREYYKKTEVEFLTILNYDLLVLPEIYKHYEEELKKLMS
jgi:hypothetical protein